MYSIVNIKNQNFHPVPPKVTKISVSCMKFQGASIGKGPGGPKKFKKLVFLIWAPGRRIRRPDVGPLFKGRVRLGTAIDQPNDEDPTDKRTGRSAAKARAHVRWLPPASAQSTSGWQRAPNLCFPMFSLFFLCFW